jgi:hypothetical protein
MTPAARVPLKPRLPARACALLAAIALAGLGCGGPLQDIATIAELPNAAVSARAAPLQVASGVLPDEVWASLGGTCIGRPAVVVLPSGQLQVFARGTDHALWARRYDRGWSEWQSLGGILGSSPAVAAGPDGTLDVFVRGTDSALWHRGFAGSWGEWQSLGGVLTSEPAAVSPAPGRLDVVARGGDGAIWHRAHSEGQWHEWTSLGGHSTSAPAVTSWGGARLDVFARGTDHALWQRSRDIVPSKGAAASDSIPTWGDWQSRGGVLWSDPAAVSPRPGHIDVAVRGTDNALWTLHHDSGVWQEWRSPGGKLLSAPAAAATRDQWWVLGAGADNTATLLHACGPTSDWHRLDGTQILPPPQ